jgi:homoserine dehydrogenase
LQIEKSEEIIEKIKAIFSEKDLADLFFKDNMTETPLLPVIIITKKIKEDKLDDILNRIEALNGVLTINNIIPIKERVN